MTIIIQIINGKVIVSLIKEQTHFSIEMEGKQIDLFDGKLNLKYWDLQQMFSLAKGLILNLLILYILGSYLQLPLVRTPQSSKSYNFLPITCKNQSTLNDDAQFKEICYQKDITYSIVFIKDGMQYSLSADFTTPISWIKGVNCVIEGTNQKCNRLTETIIEKIKEKANVGGRSRLHKMVKSKEIQNTIIEGSSETIRGEIVRSTNISLTIKDSSRLNNFFQLIMLGLFIYGEKDNLALVNTNFVNAMFITPNLNGLSDGALSLRFDETAETSFLQEIFTYEEAIQKTVTVYLGENNTITIGDMTAKYTKYGYGGISWISMPDEEGFGRLPELVGIGVSDVGDDKEYDTVENISVVFTLSASYISLPEKVISESIIEAFNKDAVCKINTNNFVECSSSHRKKLQKILQNNLILKFEGSNLIIPMDRLLLKIDHGKRAILNIKKSYNNKAILGQPIFQKYFFAFDYLKNRIGFAQKRDNFDQFFIDIVTLVRFLCTVMVIGCGFICCFEPCDRLMKKIKKWKKQIKKQKPRKNQYSSVTESKSEDLGSAIEDVVEPGSLGGHI